jgi:hypothetical protein
MEEELTGEVSYRGTKGPSHEAGELKSDQTGKLATSAAVNVLRLPRAGRERPLPASLRSYPLPLLRSVSSATSVFEPRLESS